MSKRRKRENRVEVPAIGEPLENPNFVTPTAITGLTEVPGFQSPAFTTDPFGSWTGRPLDLAEIPVQDADDL